MELHHPEQQLWAYVEAAKEAIRQDVHQLLSEGELQPILLTIAQGVNLKHLYWRSSCRKAMFDAVVHPEGLGHALAGRFTVIIDDALRNLEMQVMQIGEAVGSTTMQNMSPVFRDVRERLWEEIQADFVAMLLKNLRIAGAVVLGAVIVGGALAAGMGGAAVAAAAVAALPVAAVGAAAVGGVHAVLELTWQEVDVKQDFARELAEKLASQCDQQLLLQSLFLLLDHAREQLAAALQGRPPPPPLQPARAHDAGPADQTAWPAFESVVWHDPNIGNDENQQYIQRLRGQFPDLQVFASFNDAEQHVRDNPLTSFTVLSSGSNGKDLMERIHERVNLERCYIFCRALEYHKSWAKDYRKVLDVVVNIKDVVRRLSEPPPSPQFVFYQVEQFDAHFNEVMRIYAHSQLNSCAESLPMEDCVRHFVQVRNENPKHFAVTSDAKIAMWTAWFSSPEAHYKDLLKLYTSNEMFHALNEAMRQKRRNHGLLMIMKLAEGLVRAICEALRRKPERRWDGMVFRGLTVSDDELAEIRQSVGKYVCLRSFTSTSTSRDKATSFGSRAGRKVLMEIDCGAVSDEVQCTPPMFIGDAELSVFPSEDEVLFQPLVCFKVLGVEEQAGRTNVQMNFAAGMREMPAAFMYAFM